MKATLNRILSFSLLLVGLLLTQVGCGLGRSQLDQRLLAGRSPGQHATLVAEYTVNYPDVLEVTVAEQPNWSGRRPIALDGRLADTPIDVRVEGCTPRQIEQMIAKALHVAPEAVQVVVLEFNSKQIYLHGEVQGDSRAVAYQGPETVLQLLQRVGGITPGAAPRDLKVIRSRVSEGKAAEEFQVDLVAILERGDAETNVRVQPCDQIYIAPTQRCSLKKCVPLWLHPLYDQVWGLARPGTVRRR